MTSKNAHQRSMIKKIDKNDEEEIRRDMESVRRGHNLSTIATEFLTQLVNPTKGKCVGIPTLIGGMPGRTNVFRLKQELRVVAGTNGYGFLALNYAMNGVGMTPTGPFSDTPVFCYTTAAYGTTTATGTVLKRRGTAVPAGCILAGWNLARYKFDDYTGDPDAMNSLQYRVSAAAAEVTNVTAVLEQNGTIVMWEPPNHGIVNATSDISLDTVMSEFTSRVISAQNGSNRNDKVVLNYHHKHLAAWPYVSNVAADFSFKSFNSASPGPLTQMPDVNNGLFVFEGKPGDAFHVTVTAVYEVKGRKAQGVKPRLVDPIGMGTISNILAAKVQDGYVGNPRRVSDGYLAKAYEVTKKLGGFVKKNEDTIIKGTGAVLKQLAGLI